MESTEEAVARVEAILREDIKWAIESGIGWDPGEPAQPRGAAWVKRDVACGVCALGAHVIRHEVSTESYCDSMAARSLGISEHDADEIYYGVLDVGDNRAATPSPWSALAYRLRDYADELAIAAGQKVRS
jgi:hypothetical protein